MRQSTRVKDAWQASLQLDRPAQWTHTSDGASSQRQYIETPHQYYSERGSQSPIPESRRGHKRRRLELLRGLQGSGKEVTFTTLSAAFRFNDKVTNLFLTGPMQCLEDFRHFFTGGEHINEFLTAALGPEPIAHTGLTPQSTRVKRAWWAAIHAVSEAQASDTTAWDPQANSEAQSRSPQGYGQSGNLQPSHRSLAQQRAAQDITTRLQMDNMPKARRHMHR